MKTALQVLCLVATIAFLTFLVIEPESLEGNAAHPAKVGQYEDRQREGSDAVDAKRSRLPIQMTTPSLEELFVGLSQSSIDAISNAISDSKMDVNELARSRAVFLGRHNSEYMNQLAAAFERSMNAQSYREEAPLGVIVARSEDAALNESWEEAKQLARMIAQEYGIHAANAVRANALPETLCNGEPIQIPVKGVGGGHESAVTLPVDSSTAGWRVNCLLHFNSDTSLAALIRQRESIINDILSRIPPA